MPSKKTLDDAFDKLYNEKIAIVLSVVREARVAKAQQAQINKKNRLVKQEIKKTDKGVARSFTIWYKAFKKGFKTLRPLFAESLVIEAPTPSDLDPILDESLEVSNPSMEKALMDGIEATIVVAGQNMMTELGIQGAFDVATDPEVIAYIAQRSSELIVQINDTTRKEIKVLLEQAAREGWSWQRTGRAIEERAARWGIIGAPIRATTREIRTRAELIAVTEIGNAYEEGSSAMSKKLAQAGFEMQKRWLTVGDDRVDPHCKANGNEGWIPMNDAHTSGVMHPLDHPGCRCTELYKVVL